MGRDDDEAMVLVVIVLAGFIAYRKGLLQPYIEKLKTLMPGAVPQGGAPVPGVGGGGGPISSSGTCVGTPLSKDDRSDRFQYNGKGLSMDAYEVTWCGTIGDQGEDLTFKMYGPSHHSSGDCCWCVMHVDKAGKMTPGGEGPHPSSNCEHPGGGTAGPAPCYKATMQPGPLQEGYALVGGAWKKVASYKGPCGCSKKASTRTGDTLMVRCDGSLTTKCASWKPLGGAAPAAPKAAAYSESEGSASGVILIPRISLS